MSRRCDIQISCATRVKKAAVTAATVAAATATAAAAAVAVVTTATTTTTIATAAAATVVAVAVDLTAVLEYASAAECCKLAAVVSITHPDEINTIRGNEIIMTDTAAATAAAAAAAAAAADTQKRANFSALTVGNPNGVNKISPSLANAKPGSAKKLVIKNFKSKRRSARSNPDLTSNISCSDL